MLKGQLQEKKNSLNYFIVLLFIVDDEELVPSKVILVDLSKQKNLISCPKAY